MKISFILPKDEFSHKIADEFQRFGIEVVKNDCTEDCDFLIGLSHSLSHAIKHYHHLYPSIPMIKYNWDMYEWIWKEPRGYNWPEYGELLNRSIENWCPSEEVRLRAEEFFGCGHNHKVIKSYARFFEHHDIRNGGYVYNPLRAYTSDRNYGWAKRACNELGIPLVESLHRLSEQDFQRTIAHATLLTCEYYEASTGGLTLLEGFKLGKPVLVSDSKYMGAGDYFGDQAHYFKYNNFNDYKEKIEQLFNNPPEPDYDKIEDLCSNYTLTAMTDKMYERIKILKEKSQR